MIPSLSRVLLTTLIVLLTVTASNLRTGSAADTPAQPLVLGAASLDGEQRKGEQLVETLHLTEAMGPLAPVALSPFFALTCLSGASLLADSGILPSAIARNPILGHGSALNNPIVFAGLLILTLVTAAPKLTKVTKPLAQAVDQIEAHAGIIAVVAVQFLSQLKLGEAEPETAQLIVQAGIFSATWNTVVSVGIAVASAINIFVVNTVKFFFEVLTWLSPFPAVDAAFEAANKAAAAFLLGVYVWSPTVAFVLNLLIFLVCLMIFAWAHRRVVYMRSVLSDPILGWFAETVFRRAKVTPVSTPLPGAIASRLPDRTLVLKAFAGRPYQDLKRKARGYLVRSEGRLFFAKPRWFRAPIVVPLPQEGHRVELSKGLLSNTVVFADNSGEAAMKVVITRRYNALLESIGALLGTDAAPSTVVGERVLAAARSVGAAAKAGAGRDELRAELA